MAAFQTPIRWQNVANFGFGRAQFIRKSVKHRVMHSNFNANMRPRLSREIAKMKKCLSGPARPVRPVRFWPYHFLLPVLSLVGVGYNTLPSGGVVATSRIRYQNAMASCSRFVVPDLPLTPHQPSGHRFPKRAFGKKNRAGGRFLREKNGVAWILT